MKNPIKHKAGTQAYATIADDEMHKVCDEWENFETGLDGMELYRRFAAQVQPKWPEEATEPDIRKLARTELEKLFEAAQLKKQPDDEEK